MSTVRWANRSSEFGSSSNRLVRGDELPACLIAGARGDLLYHPSATCGRISPRQGCETYVRVSNFVRNDGFVGKRALRRWGKGGSHQGFGGGATTCDRHCQNAQNSRVINQLNATLEKLGTRHVSTGVQSLATYVSSLTVM
jgi:hypothetical protein